jgi:hypothetical protein
VALWWSARNSTPQRMVEEWRLILNKSIDNTRQTANTIRDILLDWLVPLAKENFFFVTECVHNKCQPQLAGSPGWYW